MGEKPVGKFEDLEIWKEGMRLATKIYDALEMCRDFGLRDQMQRSAVSIPSNIAKGYDRGTNKEFVYFLNVAKGSCAELRTQIYLAQHTGIISERQSKNLLECSRKLSAMLYKFICSRRKF